MNRFLPLLLGILFVCLPVVAQERAINEKITVKAGLDEVWNAWTTTAGIKTFFAPDAKIEAKVDGAFEVYMLPSAPIGLRGGGRYAVSGHPR